MCPCRDCISEEELDPEQEFLSFRRRSAELQFWQLWEPEFVGFLRPCVACYGARYMFGTGAVVHGLYQLLERESEELFLGVLLRHVALRIVIAGGMLGRFPARVCAHKYRSRVCTVAHS